MAPSRIAPIQADPWFVARIPVFFSEVHEGARSIVQTLACDGAMSRIETAAEQLRSHAVELGLSRIEQLLGELKRVAVAGDGRAARAVADELIRYVTHVQVIYRRPTRTTTSAPQY